MENFKKRKLIILTKDEKSKMQEFFGSCFSEGFQGINNFSKMSADREFFYYWHLHKVFKKFDRERSRQMAFLSLTAPEIRSVKAMFQRVDCSEETQEIQTKF